MAQSVHDSGCLKDTTLSIMKAKVLAWSELDTTSVQWRMALMLTRCIFVIQKSSDIIFYR